MEGEYAIKGLFWRREDRFFRDNEHYPFVGDVIIRADGKIEGETKDEFGEADINGEIKEGLLTFKKRYRPGSSGARYPIHYTLTTRDTLGGGWLGTCLVPQDDGTNDVPWQTACLMFPR